MIASSLPPSSAARPAQASASSSRPSAYSAWARLPAPVESHPRSPASSSRRQPFSPSATAAAASPALSSSRAAVCREPEIYGRESLDEIHDGIAVHAAELGLEVDFFQSNHEGALIDRLHQRNFDVAIVNAGGLTHTSISLRDALLGVQRPFWEVHLSDPSTREPFRHVNYLHDIAQASVVGQGARGYHVALEAIAERFGGAA